MAGMDGARSFALPLDLTRVPDHDHDVVAFEFGRSVVFRVCARARGIHQV